MCTQMVRVTTEHLDRHNQGLRTGNYWRTMERGWESPPHKFWIPVSRLSDFYLLVFFCKILREPEAASPPSASPAIPGRELVPGEILKILDPGCRVPGLAAGKLVL